MRERIATKDFDGNYSKGTTDAVGTAGCEKGKNGKGTELLCISKNLLQEFTSGQKATVPELHFNIKPNKTN